MSELTSEARERARRTFSQRLLSKIAFSDTGCWEWTAGLFGTGYGGYWLDGATRLAHHVVWQAFHGEPASSELDHLCRNRACVNPEHLEPVTHAENMRRADIALGIRSAKTHCPQRHEYNEENTDRRNGRRYCRACQRARSVARRQTREVAV